MNEAYPFPAEDLDYLLGEEPTQLIKGIGYTTYIGEHYIKPLFVIVEVRAGRGLGMSAKRELKEQFTEAERKVLANWYARLYAYCLRTGVPHNGVRMRISTYNLLRRFADFYASAA